MTEVILLSNGGFDSVRLTKRAWEIERPLIHIFGKVRCPHPIIRNEFFKYRSMNGRPLSLRFIDARGQRGLQIGIEFQAFAEVALGLSVFALQEQS